MHIFRLLQLVYREFITLLSEIMEVFILGDPHFVVKNSQLGLFQFRRPGVSWSIIKRAGSIESSDGKFLFHHEQMILGVLWEMLVVVHQVLIFLECRKNIIFLHPMG